MFLFIVIHPKYIMVIGLEVIWTVECSTVPSVLKTSSNECTNVHEHHRKKYLNQLWYMNIMRGSVKSDWGIRKIMLCVMAELYHSLRGNFSELTCPTPSCTMLFHASFYLIIGLHTIIIRFARLLAMI